MSFQIVIEAATKRQIFITPIRNSIAAPESEWVPITDGSGLDRNACGRRTAICCTFSQSAMASDAFGRSV
jgi:hypothetical protein